MEHTTIENLTKKQSEMLQYVIQEIARHGFPPAGREIASFSRIQPMGRVYCRRSALEKKDYLKREPKKPGGLGALCRFSVPVRGEIPEDSLSCDRFFNREDLLHLKGQGMVDEGIVERNIIVVKPPKTAGNNDIVTGPAEGEILAKRFMKDPGGIKLIPAKKEMVPITARANEAEISRSLEKQSVFEGDIKQE